MIISNPYEDLYRSNVKKVTSLLTIQQAQQMATQMSLIYNAFGTALKDIVKLTSLLYSKKQQRNSAERTQTNPQKSIQKVQKEKQKQIKQHKQSSHQEKSVQSGIQNSVNYPDFNKYMIQINQNRIKKASQNKNNRFDNKNNNKVDNTIENNKAKTVERVEVVRGKKQRQALNGYSCTMCADFYKALGEDYTDSNGTNRLCNDCSRHRSNLPPTYFNMDFSQEFGFDD